MFSEIKKRLEANFAEMAKQNKELSEKSIEELTALLASLE